MILYRSITDGKLRALFVSSLLPRQLLLLLSQRFHVARDCDRRDDRASLCVCVCVAAEAESVLLDRKADVRSCVGVCVSNKDESDPVTQLARILHYTHHFATPHTRSICPIWLLRLGPFGPDEASSLISWVTSFSDTTTSVHCVAPAARVSF